MHYDFETLLEDLIDLEKHMAGQSHPTTGRYCAACEAMELSEILRSVILKFAKERGIVLNEYT